MNVISPVVNKIDLSGLIEAMKMAHPDDSMMTPLTPAQWDVIAPYLQACSLTSSQVLMTQGSNDRTLYFVESGSLSVHFQDEKERLRLAVVGAGGIVGEGAFFSNRPRSATVQAAVPSKLWSLTVLRFTELSNRQPAVALALVMGLGSVMAKRMGNRRRRVATT